MGNWHRHLINTGYWYDHHPAQWGFVIMATINDCFTKGSVSEDGTVNYISASDVANKKALYVVNQQGIKLLKIAVKNEEGDKDNKNLYAQLKIIRYGFKRALLWEDKPTDPKVLQLRDDVELTYHGSRSNQKSSKIHFKEQGQYKNLLDNALELPIDGIEQPAPLFAFELGCFHNKESGDNKTRSGHVIKPDEDGAVRFEFYIMSKSADLQAFASSTYFLNLLFSQDYLSAAQSGVLRDDKIIAPIYFLPMGSFWLVVKRSASQYTGQPRLVFYNNKNYQSQWLDRSTGYKKSDGTFVWSTMREDEKRLRNGGKV